MAQALPHAHSPDSGPGQSPSHHIHIHGAHGQLVQAIICAMPHTIAYRANARDVEERAEHIETITAAFRDYLAVILDDTADITPCGTLDTSDYLGILDDTFGDLNGALSKAAHDLWNEDRRAA